MALILNIDKAIDTASVCLAKNGSVLSVSTNERQKDHGSWLHVTIKELFEKHNLELKEIDALAVTEGPGSYTGLRIGISTAKGICYALNKPLITINTLMAIANAASSHSANVDFLCPMIDARRMDVFTAIYSKTLKVVKEPVAMTLNENSFDEELAQNNILFFGNGSNKFSAIQRNSHAIFVDVKMDAVSMISLSESKWSKKEFADLAYVEPLYLKEFYTPSK